MYAFGCGHLLWGNKNKPSGVDVLDKRDKCSDQQYDGAYRKKYAQKTVDPAQCGNLDDFLKQPAQKRHA